MNRLHCWVINLDRAPERMARASEQLQRLQLPFSRLPAVDARAFTAQQRASLDEPAYQRLHGQSPVLGELGCFLSHVEVMHQLLNSQAEFALVLEDDVLLNADLPAVLNGLMQHANRWDVVKLSAVHSGTPVPYLEVAPGYHLAVSLTRNTGSSAYVMNRRAAKVYAQSLLPMTLPYDHIFDKGWRFGLKFRLITPTPCEHDAHIESTIAGAPGPSRKFHWTKRLPCYAYRLGNECRRLVYGVSQVVQEKLRLLK